MGGGGGHSSLFVVVGAQLAFGVPFSVMWLLTGGGGVTWRVLAANRQWAVDSGGAGLVGWVVIDMVRLLTVSIQNDGIVPHQSALHGYHIVQRRGPAHSWGGSWLWGCGVQFSCHRMPVIAFVMCGCSRY